MRDIDKLALAAFLHDIGKFAQRAEITITKKIKDYNYVHAAFSAEVLDRYKNIFDLTDEEIDYAAMHHNLNREMDDEYWIIAAADRLASGFERERFEDYNKKSEFEHFKKQHLKSIFDEKKVFPLKELAPENIFTSKSGDYQSLWTNFIKDLKNLKEKSIENIDYLYKKYTSFIPSSTTFKLKDYEPVKANIPLYEHSKTTAIFASAIAKLIENGNKSVIDYYKYQRKEDFEKEQFLIVFGDFFGIQNFIFDNLKAKYASKILRAKSAYIEIFTKTISKYITKELNISEFSIIFTSAGKFEILVHNTDEVKEKLANIQKELNEFCIQEFYAKTGIGIGFVECGIKNFIEEGAYKKLREKIDEKLELIKLNKFDLKNRSSKLEYDSDVNNQNLCDFCEIRKATKKDEYNICEFCDKFVKLGQRLVNKKFLQITTTKTDIHIFKDYYLDFKENKGFDISKNSEYLGYPKWEISSYVAKDNENILTFEDLAKRSVKEGIKDNERKRGIEALAAIKADVDGMGKFILGEAGIDVTRSFAKYNFFSRLMNYFFSLYVPYKMEGRDIYTVFSGGDDLYIIGAWDEALEFLKDIREDFIRFCEGKMSLSAGVVIVKPNKPVNFISKVVEEKEETAKEFPNKNALAVFNEVVDFDIYLEESEFLLDILEEFDKKFELSTAFLYRLFEFINSSKNFADFNDYMWISRFNYSFRRNIEEKSNLSKEELENFKKILFNSIKNEPDVLNIVLHEFIYKRRKNG